MTAINNLRFHHQCPCCHQRRPFEAQFRAGGSFGGDGGIDRFYGYAYQIGDVLPWFEAAEERNTWPSDYSYVKFANDRQGPRYVLDEALGDCPNCKAKINFYVKITDRRILRIVGAESDDLNDLSIVHDDGRREEMELNRDWFLEPLPEN